MNKYHQINIITYTAFTLMRFKPRFHNRKETAGNRKYPEKIVKEPYWRQSRREPSASFHKRTEAFRRQKYSSNQREPRLEPHTHERAL